jgi:tetratricopeptide (TPR) repeat protein
MRKLSLVLLMLALSPALFGSRALAQGGDGEGVAAGQSEAEREARAHYALGQTAFKAGRYDQAVTEFEAGFAALPRPGFLLNIGHAERRRGNLRKARAAYKKFLLVEPTTKLRDDVMALLADLDSALADEDHAERAAATASITPPPLPAVPAPAPAQAPPVTLSVAPPPAPPIYRRPWFWAAAGAVVLGAVTAIYLSQRSPADDGFHATGSLGAVHP